MNRITYKLSQAITNRAISDFLTAYSIMIYLLQDLVYGKMTMYDIDEADYLGKGGFGEVYGINERMAIKVVHVGRDEHLKKETLQEIQFLLTLKLLYVARLLTCDFVTV